MSLVIAAIPQVDDPVWKISSEKVPHLTLLFLGDNVDQVEQIALFVEHAAKIGLTRFGLDVDRRGTLGSDNADVLFFQDNWELPRVRQFRDLLLKEPNIKTAWDSADQFGPTQEWVPHLTLGYPTSPAKNPPNVLPLYWVQFDRIAVWTGDYSGPEFILDRYSSDYPMEVAMSDTSAHGRQFLAHHGVLGMHWGRSRKEPRDISVTNVKTGGKTKMIAKGGGNHPPHQDAIGAAIMKQKMKKSGMSALSNKELQDLQTRMQLESNVGRLNKETSGAGRKFVMNFVESQGKQMANKAAQDFVNQQFEGAKKRK